jgi:hypothetical protein
MCDMRAIGVSVEIHMQGAYFVLFVLFSASVTHYTFFLDLDICFAW